MSLLFTNFLGTADVAADVSQSIVSDPGSFTEPIAVAFGYICNFLFNMVYSPGGVGALAITIILFSIVTRLILLPLAVKQQKSMTIFKKIQPEMKKIQAKYAGKKDAETQRKMAVEIQVLQKENGYSALAGCLPVAIQLPILYVLFYVMRETYLYIDVIGNLYTQMSQIILKVENIGNIIAGTINNVPALSSIKTAFDLKTVGNCEYVLSKLGQGDWNYLLSQMPQGAVEQIQPLLSEKNNIESFIGLSLIEAPGISWPGIIIPAFSVVFSLLSSWILFKQQKSTIEENKMLANQQKIMMFTMPILSGWMAMSFPTGLGLYWIMTYVIQIIQQVVLYRIFSQKNTEEVT